MQCRKLREKLENESSFVVELTGGLGFNFAPIEEFLRAYKSAGSSVTPADFSLR